jgi:hypothetical protein
MYQAKYYIQSTSFTGPTDNDTIVRNQVFDNYLAYDDGTAEKSYYLHPWQLQLRKNSHQYHLNKPGAVGLSNSFGRQIPFANNKPLYQSIFSHCRF